MDKIKASIDPASLSSLKIDALRGDKRISSATGFFYKNGDRRAFVSNWHVFSGRNPYTGQPLKLTGETPTALRCSYFDAVAARIITFEIPAGCDHGSGKWLQHPSGQKIDVALVRFDSEADVFALSNAPMVDGTPPKNIASEPILRICSNVFIVGFPDGMQKQDFLPIWKQGSVATEPDVPVEQQPVFLVDSATREGMSGSPVYFHASTYEVVPAPGTLQTFKIGGPPIQRFLGIYSGRYGVADEVDSLQLARVWKKQVIDEILANGVPAEYQLT